MTSRKKEALFVLLLSMLAFSGCAGFLARKTLHTVRGPSGTVVEAQPLIGRKALARYERIEIADFTTDVPALVSSSITQAVTLDCVNALRSATVNEQQGDMTVKVPVFTSVRRTSVIKPGGAAGTLGISGVIIYYDRGSRDRRIAGIGGEAELVARVQLIDKQSGKKLADISVRGELKGGFSGGESSEVTRGLAKALTTYILRHH